MRIGLPVVVVMAVAIGGPVEAQEDDWDLLREPELNRTVASLVFTDGFAVAARCSDGVFDLMLAGLPRNREDHVTRTIEIGLGDQAMTEQSWMTSAEGDTVFSRLPARFARELREGGLLRVQVPAEGAEPARRFVVELPPSPAAINETLIACDRPINDTRLSEDSWVVPEDGSPSGYRWLRAPRPVYPNLASTMEIPHGLVAVSCVRRPDGRLDLCEIESEAPGGYGFGDATLRSLGDARLTSSEGQEYPDSVVVFSINYGLAITSEGRIGRID